MHGRSTALALGSSHGSTVSRSDAPISTVASFVVESRGLARCAQAELAPLLARDLQQPPDNRGLSPSFETIDLIGSQHAKSHPVLSGDVSAVAPCGAAANMRPGAGLCWAFGSRSGAARSARRRRRSVGNLRANRPTRYSSSSIVGRRARVSLPTSNRHPNRASSELSTVRQTFTLRLRAEHRVPCLVWVCSPQTVASTA
jgi:hypothetical protein